MTAAVAIVFLAVFAGVCLAGLSKEIAHDEDENRPALQCRGARRAA